MAVDGPEWPAFRPVAICFTFLYVFIGFGMVGRVIWLSILFANDPSPRITKRLKAEKGKGAKQR